MVVGGTLACDTVASGYWQARARHRLHAVLTCSTEAHAVLRIPHALEFLAVLATWPNVHHNIF